MYINECAVASESLGPDVTVIECGQNDTRITDTMYAVLSGVSTMLDPLLLSEAMSERRNAGVFAASIGSMTVR
jgi:hypothetical protein